MMGVKGRTKSVQSRGSEKKDDDERDGRRHLGRPSLRKKLKLATALRGQTLMLIQPRQRPTQQVVGVRRLRGAKCLASFTLSLFSSGVVG